MRADWAIGILDGDWDLEDRPKSLPDVKPLGVTANKDRNRLEVAHRFARRFRGNDAHSLCRYGCFARRYHRIQLWLQRRFGEGQLSLELVDLRGHFRLGVLSLLLCLGRGR